MDKQYSFKFELNSKLLSILYLCYKYNFPLSYMLSLYESFNDKSLFVFKALACKKKVALNDNTFVKILQQSRQLYKQILKGVSTLIEIDKIKRENVFRQEKLPIPQFPSIDYSEFNDDYSKFIRNYLLVNIKDIYAQEVELMLTSRELHQGVGC